jgi:mono/diheme cytochrome c family protein
MQPFSTGATMTILVCATILCAIWTASVSSAQTELAEGDAQAGRTLAFHACSSCHIVAPDQPFMPVNIGPPRPPDFREIANRPSTTAASLRGHMESLPAVPAELQMARPQLSGQQLQDIIAFIVSLRDKP